MTKYVAIAVALAIIGGVIFWQGGKSDRLQREIENRQTLERINEATTDERSPDDIDRRLRELAK